MDSHGMFISQVVIFSSKELSVLYSLRLMSSTTEVSAGKMEHALRCHSITGQRTLQVLSRMTERELTSENEHHHLQVRGLGYEIHE